MRYGSGELVYEVLEGWGKLPEGWDFVEVGAAAADSQDRVYALNRGEHPMVVFDRDGNFLTSWGEDIFTERRGHGICIDADDCVYCVDDGDHTVRKFTSDGKLLLTLGVPFRVSDTGYVRGQPFSVKRSGPPFNRPTGVAVGPDGDMFVADGYGNTRVHRFAPDGRLLYSWGEPGSGPGEFRLVHAVGADKDGTVYVADRLNNRVQVFTGKGEYITQWPDVYQPDDLFLDNEGHVIIAELGLGYDWDKKMAIPPDVDPHPRVTIRDKQGRILLSIGSPDPRAPGGFLAPHSARTDSRGDLYIADVCAINAMRRGLDRKDFRTLQKFVRVRGGSQREATSGATTAFSV
jgi:DNA-binding beta-propeller fold protein YncE